MKLDESRPHLLQTISRLHWRHPEKRLSTVACIYEQECLLDVEAKEFSSAEFAGG